jgi:fused signal recognition particle receptor
MSWFQRVKEGLSKTASTITSSIGLKPGRKKIDKEMLYELEESLLLADLGVATTEKIISDLSRLKLDKEADDSDIRAIICDSVLPILSARSKTLEFSKKPHVLLLCGVNGNGKTTTAGKIAYKLTSIGKKVMLAACDTFRAAATDQLSIWAQRSGAKFVRGEHNSDPASVAYSALAQAQTENYDVLIIDTAGRLHTKQNLMDELEKIIRVLKKLDDSAPHDCVLVIDATTGQNAISQVDIFSKTVNLNGLIITKLDGTAKGGILVSIAQKFNIPILAIGVGESIDDLDNFNPKEFVEALIPQP